MTMFEHGERKQAERVVGVVNLFGLPFRNATLAETVNLCEGLLRAGKCGLVVPTNTDLVVKLSRDPAFREAYGRATLIVADGMPIVCASRLLGTPLKARVAGADLLPALCERAAQRSWRVFFLGGMPGVAEKAAARLMDRYPGLRVVGSYAPPFGFESDAAESERIVTMVRTARPDVLFVGVGAPKQEKWSAAHLNALGAPLVPCVGAAFDFVAETVRRAPTWMQRSGLEWLFRLLQEPRRLWKRYAVDFLAFGPIVLAERRRRSARRG